MSDPAAPNLNGSQTLSYSYNLAGEVASVTDPTGVAVNYGYDKTGRLSGVTGATFAGVSQYATAMAYRAFGGLKSMTYGNSIMRTQSYDARQQLATFRVGTLLSADFEYHADGAIRYAKDNTDAVKDRAYRYDQAGRLAEGLSGAEARGLSVADGVYRQSYQYDAWSNLTGRAVNRFWSGGESFSATYFNNREQGALYDADGRVTRDSSQRTHT
jgi:YD repeat-containing protein